MTAQLPAENESSRDKLLQRQAELTAQLKEAQIALYSEDEPEVLAERTRLQISAAQYQQQWQHSQAQYEQTTHELAQYDKDREQILLDAIQQQDCFLIQNKRELLFQKTSGYILPCFQFMPHISYKADEWEKECRQYAPSDFHIGEWIHNSDKNISFIQNNIIWFYPAKYRGQKNVNLLYFGYYDRYKYQYMYDFGESGKLSSTSRTDSWDSFALLPYLDIFPNHEQILPDYPRLTASEKAQLILDFFIAQDFVPFFENNKNEDDDDNFNESLAAEANQIFPHYRARALALRELAEVETQLAALPAAPTQPETLSAKLDLPTELRPYDLPAIAQSVWQYSQAAQQWLGSLKTRLDAWAQQHADWLADARAITQSLSAKLPPADGTTLHLLKTRRQALRDALAFSLDPVQAALTQFLAQAQTMQRDLENINGKPNSLALLADLEHAPRPSFALLAEHTAQLCGNAVARFEWLGEHQEFVHAVIADEEKSSKDYIAFTELTRREFMADVESKSIDEPIAEKCFAEWAAERRALLEQWLPLVQAGLNGTLPADTVLAVLKHLHQYQDDVDMFYRMNRVSIYIEYADDEANGARLEALKVAIKREEICHALSQNLRETLFALPSSSQRVWLAQFAENWQTGILNGIEAFLHSENLAGRSEVAKLIAEEMHEIRRQSLAACLQDAQAYSAALEEREKSFNALMFKMRKAVKGAE